MKDLFVSNRARLSEALHGGIVVLCAYSSMQRGNDMAFKFEQEANFWWLTGIERADWWVIIDNTRQKTTLVSPDISQSHQIFDGSLDEKTALAISGADAVISEEEAGRMLRDLAKKHSIVYTLGDQPYAEHFDFHVNPAQKKMYDQLKRTFNSVQDCRKELARLRAVKQPAEIESMKKAIRLTVDAFADIKSRLESFAYEYEIEAEFSYLFRRGGAEGHAYDPIVAAGKNACTLHYIDNSARLKKRHMLLLDIGARHDGYAADITRTYALGEPTKRQAAVHDAVKHAQAEIISLIQPQLSVEQYQKDVDRIMSAALMGLGLMKSANDEDSFRKYFPHAISHGLGVDVHDSLGGPKYLQPGMVLTVEPGIYIPEEGIGVRIEDDILVTEKGHNNLSGMLSTDF
jgi:Xaa-Pro aminopeptidase